jgi:hypothetical protein
MRQFKYLLAAMALLAGSGELGRAVAHEVLRGRLVFAYHDRPAIGVVDLDSGEVTHRFAMPRANPGLVSADNGRLVFVLTGDDEGRVKILDTGIRLESHGDHVDVEKHAVRLLNVAVTGERPSHIASGFGQTAVFFDGPRPSDRRGHAKAVIFDNASLLRGKGRYVVWNDKGPQHGVAVPLTRTLWAITTSRPEYAAGQASSLPAGVAIFDRSRKWRKIGAFDDVTAPAKSCKELHGYGTTGNVHVFACNGSSDDRQSDGGLLVMHQSGRTWVGRKLSYPDARRVSHIVSHPHAKILVGNYGVAGRYDALIRIDPAAGSLAGTDIFPVPGGQPVCQFVIAANGSRVANLLPDGSLRIYEFVPAWKEVGRFEAVAPFDCSHNAGQPRPALAGAGDLVFVSDPANRRIREYDVVRWRQGPEIPVDGVPANLPRAAAGICTGSSRRWACS